MQDLPTILAFKKEPLQGSSCPFCLLFLQPYSLLRTYKMQGRAVGTVPSKIGQEMGQNVKLIPRKMEEEVG